MRDAIPAEMTAVECAGTGGPEVLRLARMAVPAPGPDEVLIRVAAAGVNRPDLLQRKGAYPPPPGASPLLGLEVAGVIAAVGSDLPEEAVGSAVCALTNGGGYAEYVTAPHGQCLRWPDGYDAVLAAALPETSFTVWHNLFDRGAAEMGQTVLVHGGSSGIGTTAIQYATALGLAVYATAGTDEKCAACERLGAAAAINYRTQDFAVEIARLTGGAGVDVILDMVGARYLERNLECLAFDGRLVFIAMMGGAVAEKVDLGRILRRRLAVTGSTLRPRSADAKAEIATALRRVVWPILDDGRARPVIHAIYPLARVAEAHAALEEGAHVGKIMLSVGVPG